MRGREVGIEKVRENLGGSEEVGSRSGRSGGKEGKGGEAKVEVWGEEVEEFLESRGGKVG